MSVLGASFANAANCCASFCGSGPWRSSETSASGWSAPRSKTTSRASIPFRRSACTFSHGMPATLTGQCVTRSVMSRGQSLGHGSSGPSVELELIEVAQRRAARADARRVRAQLVLRDLADRALDAEVGDVQVFLVDDRRDARVDLDNVVAHELDVEEVLDAEVLDDRVADAHQLRVVECHEVHREPSAHRLARLRMAEHDLCAVRDAVDRHLAT